MHAKIRKFWEEIGDVLVMNMSDSELFYVAPSTSGMIIATEINGEIIEYYYKDKAFSEKDMLRLIKLKAFL